ncbi:MAG: FecCD family ABC transporter permease [Bacilli bacterium]
MNFLAQKKKLALLLLGTTVSLFLGLWIGSEAIPFKTMIQLFTEPSVVDEATQTIVWQLRLPRLLLAFFVGASLSLAGASFQYLLQNPLADPYTLGVSSGASVGAVVVLYFAITIPLFGAFTLPIVAILTALLTVGALLTFVKWIDRMMRIETLILTGIILSSFLGSVLSLLMALSQNELRNIVSWLLGSVAYRSYEHVFLLLPFFVVGTLLLLYYAPHLEAISLGEERAHYLGVNVAKTKMAVLICSSILTGASVSVSGTIGFVGLIIPHAIRLLFGVHARQLFVLSIFAGGTFLVLADLVARTIASPVELPIGVITSFVGAPIFAYIMYIERKKKAF